MADYIERQRVYKKITEMEEIARNRYRDTPWDSPARERYMAQLNERTALKHMIADEPAANVREDVQGKWIKSHWRGSTSCANCSVCDFEAQHSEFRGVQKYYKICPNCGARMVGGGEQ